MTSIEAIAEIVREGVARNDAANWVTAHLQPLFDRLDILTQPGRPSADLIRESGLDAECSQGNSDDVFRDGMTCQAADVALMLREELDEIKVQAS